MKRTLIALFAAAALATPALAQQPGANQNQGQTAGVPTPQGGPIVKPTKSEVLMVQRSLNEAGFEAGPLDGVMGPRTRQALEKFKRKVGLEGTGSLDSKTVAALQSAREKMQDKARGQQPAEEPNVLEEKAPGAKAIGAPAAPSSFAVEPTDTPNHLKLLAFCLIAALGFGSYFGHYWWMERRFLVLTDDAYVKADLSVISANISGIITGVPVKENMSVQAGDVLAQIDDRDYKIAVDSARNKLVTQGATIDRLKQQAIAQQALIEQAKAQVAWARANLALAEGDFERAQTAVQQDFGSKQRLDQVCAERRAAVAVSEAAQLAAEAGLGGLDTQVKEAESVQAELQSSLDKALLDLSCTTVTAPFTGVIGNRAVQVGQYVQPGTRLLMLVRHDTAYIEANYKETQLDGIRPCQPANIVVGAAGGRVFRGTVESIAPVSGSQFSLLPAEKATGNHTKILRRVPVRIRVETAAIRDGVLRPGLSVVASINTKADGAAETAMTAPGKAEDTDPAKAKAVLLTS